MSIDYKECNIAEAIADTLINMMEQNPKVLYLDADLSRSLMGKRFDECKNNFSDQFID
ncbi:MAG: hypothetical protein GX928_02325, partial [Ruminococcaceae bacterium]|nr:hypothetical protein [Oscillospiraceae bacterium]